VTDYNHYMHETCNPEFLIHACTLWHADLLMKADHKPKTRSLLPSLLGW